MNKNQFVKKWQEECGCQNPYEICWCREVCCILEKMYRAGIRDNVKKLFLKYRFIEKWREECGCENPDEDVWCAEVCRVLEKMYNAGIRDDDMGMALDIMAMCFPKSKIAGLRTIFQTSLM